MKLREKLINIAKVSKEDVKTLSDIWEEYGPQIINDIPIKCTNCGKEFFLDAEGIERYDNCENAPMGTRINYTFRTESACPRCGQRISFYQDASEYPEGTVEGVFQPECRGGRILRLPDVEMAYYDDSLYVTNAPRYTGHLEEDSAAVRLDRKLDIAVVDGNAYLADQFYLPDRHTTIWINPAGQLLPILVEETGSIRFEDNSATFAEIIQKDPRKSAMRLLGKVAEAVIVRRCGDDAQLNRTWLSKARKHRTKQNIADTYRAIGTGLKSTKKRYPRKYNPFDTQRDIIWVNQWGECATVAGHNSTAANTAGLQVKTSSNGNKYIKGDLVNQRYEVPVAYFPINDDFEKILEKVNKDFLIVEPGVDFIDVRDVDIDAFEEVTDYYPLIFDLFSRRLSVEEFIRVAKGIMPLRNGIIATSMSMPKSEIKILH